MWKNLSKKKEVIEKKNIKKNLPKIFDEEEEEEELKFSNKKKKNDLKKSEKIGGNLPNILDDEDLKFSHKKKEKIIKIEEEKKVDAVKNESMKKSIVKDPLGGLGVKTSTNIKTVKPTSLNQSFTQKPKKSRKLKKNLKNL